MEHKWYTLQTFGGEKLVKVAIENIIEEYSLQDKISEVIVPTEDVIDVKNGKKKVSERSLYSGYVFIKMALETEVQHLVQSVPKVSGFVGEANHPTELTEKDITAILDKVNNRAAPRAKIGFESGEQVRINEGPFANFNGIVDEYDMEHGMLKLNVSIFGRSTPVDISYDLVEKII